MIETDRNLLFLTMKTMAHIEIDTNIKQLLDEIQALENKKQEKIQLLNKLKSKRDSGLLKKYSGLTTDEVSRYSRQMLVPLLGPEGQLKLKHSKILIVGAGGLGCPVSLYLAAAGIGEITLIDADSVEISNVHRQVLHREEDVGKPKVISAAEKLSSLNSNIKIIPKHMHLDSGTAGILFAQNKYDVVIDGTDNVATRYLLNDACVMHKTPLVSGSALQLEGQLTVYNFNGGPCYRCLFPKPPPPEAVTSCGDGGVMGPVPGTIGILQALETIKILTSDPNGVLAGRLLTFDGSNSTFRNIKLRLKQNICDVCGDDPKIRRLIDYEQFCGAGAHDKVTNIKILEPNEMISPKDLFNETGTNPFIIDVRPEIEYRMCSLPNTYNVPYSNILSQRNLNTLEELLGTRADRDDKNVYVLCRRGNDSQRAIRILKDIFKIKPIKFVNVTGGLHNYAKQVDETFPVY